MEETNEFRYDDEDSRVSLSEALAPRVKRDQPNISHLEDAVKFDDAGRPYLDLKVGDTLVIERHTPFLPGKPWLDTKPYYVNDVDQATGNLKLFVEDLQQHAKDNFVMGLKAGNLYKKVPLFGRWDSPPKSKPVVLVPAKPQLTEYGEPVKKGRGRPKGVKNRSKEEIKAAKAAEAEVKAIRKAARLAKRSSKK